MKRLLPLLALAAASSAWSLEVVPVRYDGPNGFSGLYSYWDESYSGSGCKTCDGAALSGGVGDLVDGIIANSNWSVVEALVGPGPYVGWKDLNPTINFIFGSSVLIDSVTFYFDDAGSGGVGAPSVVTVGGRSFSVPNPPGTAPFSFTVSELGFVGSSLPITITAGNGANWIFASEIDFTTPVPELAAWQLVLAGSAVLVGLARRRRSLDIDAPRGRR